MIFGLVFGSSIAFGLSEWVPVKRFLLLRLKGPGVK